MHRLLALALLGSTLLCGCASEDQPTLDETGSDFERGITGQGTLYQPNKENDPFIHDGAER